MGEGAKGLYYPVLAFSQPNWEEQDAKHEIVWHH